MIDKNGILSLLKNKKSCVLSTASASCEPQSAVVYYSIKDDFTFLMSTDANSRKAMNISINNQASIVVGGLDNSAEIQIDGSAVFLEGDMAQHAITYIFTLHPEFIERMSPDAKIIQFRPSWLRYSDFSLGSPEIIELTGFLYS